MLQFFLSQQLYLDLQLPQSGDELSLSLDAPALYHKHKQELSAPEPQPQPTAPSG